ncbi:MAG: hypothetical protein A2Y33_00525 [Spirochaetes bacterium GWF1_51_8]|nr:MAG: hypothetical protein A2Y33_00525 [Spirochaetes bacterium GWF1_51_8]
MNRYELRIENVQKQLKPGEACFVLQKEDVSYLTGFTGDSSYLFIAPGYVSFITDGRFTQQFREETQIEAELIEIGPGKSLSAVMTSLTAVHSVKNLLIDPEDITVALMRKFETALPALHYKFCDIVKAMRMYKDEIEIETIRRNIRITELGYHYIIREVAEGRSELEIAAELEHYLKVHGAENMSFETICASGARSALPHGRAGTKKVADGEVVLFDFGILKDGYCSDFTRCYYFGKILSSEFEKIKNIVLEALKAGEAAVKPGIPAKAVHQAVYSVIERAGYAEYFTHSTGHGVGMQVHEAPRIGANSETILSEGMVFTVEPGIYLPGKGGIRLEDIVTVRKNGCEVLTSTSYDL